jgi:CysZ protein
MGRVTSALLGAARNLFHPAVLAVLLTPALIAVIVWVGLAWWFWDSWLAAIRDALVTVADDGWLAHFDVSTFAGVAAVIVLLLLLAPAVLASAMLIAAVFAMPMLVELVARRDFAQLERRKGGTLLGGAWNAFAALAAFLVVWVLTLPVWLIAGPLAVVVPWLLSAWLNQRLFRYDALSEHASAEEMRSIFRARAGGLFTLGLTTGFLYFVPLVNLVAPTFAALAFVHYCLAELERARAGEKGLRNRAPDEVARG